jgi:ATP-dependent DNA helicase RecG
VTPLTDAELLTLLNDLESDRVERKRNWSGSVPEKVREAICAFANDLPGHAKPGVVFMGIEDDGSPSGLPVTDQLLLTLADIKSDGRIVPQPTMTVERHRLSGADVAVVCVWPADAPPVRFGGRIWIRTGPRRELASAQDERILNERRRHRDQPFDIRPVYAASTSDLSRTIFEEEYLPGAFAADVLASNQRSYEQRLAACRMVISADEPTPTVLGVVTLSRQPTFFLPGAYVQFLRIQGISLSDPVVDEALIDGPLPAMMRRLDEKLAAHNRVQVDFTSASIEKRRYLYPPAALQQITRNAIMHRTYEATSAPVRAYWFDDRIEISNPGGPYGNVTLENFGQPGYADYRNPHMAEAMRVLGLVQRFGVGIATAQAALRDNGSPPLQFRAEPTMTFVTLLPTAP